MYNILNTYLIFIKCGKGLSLIMHLCSSLSMLDTFLGCRPAGVNLHDYASLNTIVSPSRQDYSFLELSEIFLSRPAISALAEKSVSKVQSLLHSIAQFNYTLLYSKNHLAAFCHVKRMENGSDSQ